MLFLKRFSIPIVLGYLLQDPLAVAIQENNLNEVKRIVTTRPAGVNAFSLKLPVTPLLYAAINGHKDIVNFLIVEGADITKRYKGKDAFLWCAQKGMIDVMDVLIKMGTSIDDVDDKNRTALHLAIHHKQSNVVPYLAKLGASFGKKDWLGRTPAHYAAFAGNRDFILDAFVQRGSDVSSLWSQDKFGWTPLHVATALGHTEVAEIIAVWSRPFGFPNPMPANGINSVTSTGKTPLMLAASRAELTIVERLLSCGADKNLRDKRNWKAIDYASNCNSGAVRLLLNQGHETTLTADTVKRIENIAKQSWSEPPLLRISTVNTMYSGPSSGVELVLWSDGILLYSADRLAPGQNLQITFIGPDVAKFVAESITETRLPEIPDTAQWSAIAATTFISIKTKRGIQKYSWSGATPPDTDFLEEFGEFRYCWTLLRVFVDQLRHYDAIPISTVMGTATTFRNIIL